MELGIPTLQLTICTMFGFWSVFFIRALSVDEGGDLLLPFFFFLGLYDGGSTYMWRSCCKYTTNFYCQA